MNGKVVQRVKVQFMPREWSILPPSTVKRIVSISSHAQIFYLAGETHQLGMRERVIPVSVLPAFVQGSAHMVPPGPTLWMRYGSVAVF